MDVEQHISGCVGDGWHLDVGVVAAGLRDRQGPSRLGHVGLAHERNSGVRAPGGVRGLLPRPAQLGVLRIEIVEVDVVWQIADDARGQVSSQIGDRDTDLRFAKSSAAGELLWKMFKGEGAATGELDGVEKMQLELMPV